MSASFTRFEGALLPPMSQWDSKAIYTLVPEHFSPDFYSSRTGRNLAWITAEEQEMLRGMTVSIAGCGGMGGWVAAALIRMGIGRIKIADPETYDVSNLNRQFGAKLETLGANKALATAAECRSIARDTTVVAYPMGICDEIVDEFVGGSDLVCDLIEFFVVWYRTMIHHSARCKGIPVLNCNTVGHSSNLFLYTPTGMTMEEALGITPGQIADLRKAFDGGALSLEDKMKISSSMLRAVVPEGIPEYADPSCGYSTASAVRGRLQNEATASIITPGPVVAGGFLLTHILLQLLKDSPIKRKVVMVPPMPGYLLVDTALMRTSVVDKNWMI